MAESLVAEDTETDLDLAPSDVLVVALDDGYVAHIWYSNSVDYLARWAVYKTGDPTFVIAGGADSVANAVSACNLQLAPLYA